MEGVNGRHEKFVEKQCGTQFGAYQFFTWQLGTQITLFFLCILFFSIICDRNHHSMTLVEFVFKKYCTILFYFYPIYMYIWM